MYGLAANIDLSFLAGIELLEIRVGRYQVRLEFENLVAISIRGLLFVSSVDGGGHAPPISCSEGLAKAMGNASVCSTMARLIQLLGHRVDAIKRTRDGTLILSFEHSGRVTILDSNCGFESYEISHGDRTIIV